MIHEIVKSIEEAQRWFLENHSGNVICQKKVGNSTMEHTVDNFIDARKFFDEPKEPVVDAGPT